MPFKFNPFTGSLDIVQDTADTNYIPQLDADPASPSAEQVWVRKSGNAGSPMGLLLSLTTNTITYQLSYRTIEGTTKRVSIT